MKGPGLRSLAMTLSGFHPSKITFLASVPTVSNFSLNFPRSTLTEAA